MIDRRFVPYGSFSELCSVKLVHERYVTFLNCWITRGGKWVGYHWSAYAYQDDSTLLEWVEHFPTYLDAEAWLREKGYI